MALTRGTGASAAQAAGGCDWRAGPTWQRLRAEAGWHCCAWPGWAASAGERGKGEGGPREREPAQKGERAFFSFFSFCKT